MLIKDLKDDWPLIYEAAVKETEKRRVLGWHTGNNITSGFNWNDTQEGSVFWQKVNIGRIEEALKICPYLDHRVKSSKRNLRNTKIYLPIEEDNLAFQRFAKQNGVKYYGGTSEDFYKDKYFLYVTDDDYLGWCCENNKEEYFKIMPGKEVFLKDLIPGYRSKNKSGFTKEDFKNTTITLENEEQVKIFQEYVFSKDIIWCGTRSKGIKHLENRDFRIDGALDLIIGGRRDKPFKEITLDECIPNWRELLPKPSEIVSKPLTWYFAIEPWSVGTYVVFIKNYGRSRPGDIDIIKLHDLINNTLECKEEGTTTKDPNYVKWFATKEEAEEFSKALLTSDEIPSFIKAEQSRLKDQLEEIAKKIFDEPKINLWNPNITWYQPPPVQSLGNHRDAFLAQHPINIEKAYKPSLELVKKKKKLLGTVVSTNNINLK